MPVSRLKHEARSFRSSGYRGSRQGGRGGKNLAAGQPDTDKYVEGAKEIIAVTYCIAPRTHRALRPRRLVRREDTR